MSWVKDPPLGKAWLLEYAMFCLGHGLAIAGGLELQYRMGKADRDLELAREAAAKAKLERKSIVYG